MRGVLLGLLVMLLPWSAQARVTAEIVEFGEMAVESGPARAPQPDESTLSEIAPLLTYKYVNHSDHIEAALCRSFGVSVRLMADPGEGLPRRLQARLHHPKLTRPDGASSTEDSLMTAASYGSSLDAFTFDVPWEMEAGEWEFGFYLDGQKLASKAFTVTRAPGGVPSICDKPVS